MREFQRRHRRRIRNLAAIGIGCHCLEFGKGEHVEPVIALAEPLVAGAEYVTPAGRVQPAQAGAPEIGAAAIQLAASQGNGFAAKSADPLETANQAGINGSANTRHLGLGWALVKKFLDDLVDDPADFSRIGTRSHHRVDGKNTCQRVCLIIDADRGCDLPLVDQFAIQSRIATAAKDRSSQLQVRAFEFGATRYCP